MILLSQCLNYDVLPDYPRAQSRRSICPTNCGSPPMPRPRGITIGCPKRPRICRALIDEVEHFASGEYAPALQAGASLDPAERAVVVKKLHDYTGLPAAYIEKANLRISAGEFQKTLLDDADLTTGALDTRFSGPTLDPLSKEAGYDPQSAAISSAYVSVFNDYVRKELKFGDGQGLSASLSISTDWNFSHQPPGSRQVLNQQVNVMPDLASAMKHNPNLKILVNGGYFDLVDAVLRGRVRDEAPADPGGLAKEHRFQILRIRAHGICARSVPESAARQCRRVHPRHRQSGRQPID